MAQKTNLFAGENNMKKRILATCLGLCILLGLFPASVLAADPEELDLAAGSIVITDTGYQQGDGANETPHTGSYSITQTGDAATGNTITVERGTIDLTISGINIQANSSAAIAVKAGATLNLTLEGANTLTGGDAYAGISVETAFPEAAYDPDTSGKVIIKGTGSLTATGGDATNNCGAGAGIGGDGYGDSNGNGGDFGTVQIESGTVTAIGGGSTELENGAGAGIGGGGLYHLDTGNNDESWIYAGVIKISGGTVIATGGAANFYLCCGAAGIGNGAFNSGKDTFGSDPVTGADSLAIEITGGKIDATGAVSAAGIGGSSNGSSGSITIGGNAKVTAVGNADSVWGGAGIGGGDNGSSGPFSIQGDAEVQATGSGSAAGIGSGGNGGGGATEITIKGNAQVTASTTFGAGIGGGWSADHAPARDCGTITLNSTGIIVAYGGHRSQAIGMGGSNDDYTPPNSPSDNKLIIGGNTGAVWMFTSKTTTPAFYGQGMEAKYFDLASGAEAIWYTLFDGSTFPESGDASSSNDTISYQWTGDSNSLTITSESDTLAAYSHQVNGYTPGNWAYFGKGAELPTYTISADYNTLNFGTAQAGYTQPDAQTVTITNTGNQDLTVSLPVSSQHYIVTAGPEFTSGSATLAPDETATFTVRPAAGLGAGSYAEILTVTGTGVSSTSAVTVNLSFNVIAAVPDQGGGDTGYEYTLRYDTNGGEAIRPEAKSYSWTKQYEDLPTPVREGYTFDGWYLDSKLAAPVEDDIRVNRSTVTLYAGWRKDMSDPDNNGISYWLETQNHNAYLNGYGDGTFGPDNNMTRAQAAQMFYNLLLNKDVPVTVNFSDVPDDSWYATAVNTLASLGIVNGIGNNQFAPDQLITRAQFTVIAMRFTNGTTNGENNFSDVHANDWFYDQVVGSIQYGWINGYSDGTFRPNQTITRAEVTTIVNRMLDRSADEDYVDRHEADLRLFPDVSKDYWAYYEIVEATNAHNYEKNGGTENWTKLR